MILQIDDTLRLRRYDGICEFALPWYLDAHTVWMVDHRTEPYHMDLLKRMYSYLDQKGELYFIELLCNDTYAPVGDVTLCRDDLPIVIAPEFQCRGIGKRVILGLIHEAKRRGWDHLAVEEIYQDNIASQRLFEGCGFQKAAATKDGACYRLCFRTEEKL
ncbi:MAG: GNAT family N-acetyltransferase [Faecousia sp.]